MILFQQQHYPHTAWTRKEAEGCRVNTYVQTKDGDGKQVSAAEYLRRGLGVFCSYDEMIDSYCVLAKVICPDGCSATLRVDRDFYEICKTDGRRKETVAGWQGAYRFEGYRLDELWCIMEHLAHLH